MIQFIRLTRPLNLVIIIITMYGLAWYFDGAIYHPENTGITSIHFFLLVFSTVLIAAAGNIINDYFDVRADRINKPDRLIIGKYIKRRVAIVTHWGLNFVAFSIAGWLSWKLETFWYVFIHLLSINILWYYSSYFKRKLVIGNVLIAALTAMVPLLVGLYYFQSHNLEAGGMDKHFIYPFEAFSDEAFVVFLSVGLALFAFVLNLAREIVKDMEDVEGDELIRAKTVPIILGYRQAKIVIYAVLLSALFAVAIIWRIVPELDAKALLPLGISALLVLTAFGLMVKASKKSDYKLVNGCIKLAMIAGLLSPVYWKLLIVYG